MLRNSTVFFTCGAGSFGNTLMPVTLARFNPKKLIPHSHVEKKQWEMARRSFGDARLRFRHWDVRHKNRLSTARDGVSFSPDKAVDAGVAGLDDWYKGHCGAG
jgi:UDP-N-acetylglucosamine 4,6-dehydratase/5-epimerase